MAVMGSQMVLAADTSSWVAVDKSRSRQAEAEGDANMAYGAAVSSVNLEPLWAP